MRSPLPLAVIGLFLVLVPVASTGSVGQDVPNKREIQKLVVEYLELGPHAVEMRPRQLEILTRLKALPELSPRDIGRWRKDLLKAESKLDGLPETGGDNFFWEKERRGRYIVGGKRKRAKGLMIGMHGGGLGSGDAGAAASSYSSAASKLGWVAIFPEVLKKTEHGWTDSGTEEWVLDLVDRARRSFKIPPDRIYFVGHSMGGYGSWTLGAHHADRVAALAPSAGAPTPYLERGTNEVVGIVKGIVPNLRNVPMVVFQSADDPQVPPGPNRFAAKEVEAARAKWGGYAAFTYWEVDGRGHGFPKGGVIEHLEKIADHVREPRPERIVWQPDITWKRQFYWLAWEHPKVHTTVVADLDREVNAIELQVDGAEVSGLEILLDERLLDVKSEVTIRANGEELWRGIPTARLSTLLRTAVWGDPDLLYAYSIALDG